MIEAGRETAPATKGDDRNGTENHHQHGSETPLQRPRLLQSAGGATARHCDSFQD